MNIFSFRTHGGLGIPILGNMWHNSAKHITISKYQSHMSIYMFHPPIFGSPWQHTSLQAREVASTCEPDTADWCLKMADDYPIIPRETIVFPHSADIFTIFTNQTALGTWEILGIWLKTNQKLPPPIPPLRKLKMATHGVGIQGSPPVQTSHCPASHRSRKPRRSWPQMDFGPKVDETSPICSMVLLYMVT